MARAAKKRQNAFTMDVAAIPPLDSIPGVQMAPPVPMPIASLLCELVMARGFDLGDILHATGLDPSTLNDADGLLQASVYARLIHQALNLTKDPCLGLAFGMQIPPTLFGTLGFALMCASSMKEALDVGVRFAPLGSRYVHIDMQQEQESMILTIQERMPLGFAKQFAIESTIAAWLNCARHLGRRPADACATGAASIRFTWSRPPEFDMYADLLPAATFNASFNQIVIPCKLLQASLPMAQPQAARRAIAQCEQELVQTHISQASLASAVAEALVLSKDGFPDMVTVARNMGLSARTLARRLDAQQVQFRAVVGERRKLEAMHMLTHTFMTIDAISLRLGYLNPANFTRAFKRWTGETPSQFRARNKSED